MLTSVDSFINNPCVICPRRICLTHTPKSIIIFFLRTSELGQSILSVIQHAWSENQYSISIYPSNHSSIYLSHPFNIYLSVHSSIYRPIHLSIYPSMYLFIYPFICLSHLFIQYLIVYIYLFIDLSTHLSICLFCLFT